MTIQVLKEYIAKAKREYPDYRDEIQMAYELCLSEIEEGGSIAHETDLCMNFIDELVTGQLEED